MSGAEDLARLTQTIDTANELFLSEEIKMVDVGGGVQRPTNAKVLADLSTQMSGAMIYSTVALGVAGTPSGGHFSVPSAADNRYISLYRNDGGAATHVDDYPNAIATQWAEGLAQAAFELTYPRNLYEQMPWAVTDKDGQPILAVKSSGVAHVVTDKLPGLDLLGDYAWAVTDTNGVVLLGIKWSGEVVVYGLSTGAVSAFADGPIGGQDIWVLVDGVPYQVTSSGDNFSPQVSSGRLSYIRRSGGVSSVTVDVPLPGSIAPFVTTVLHILSSGQSLSMGSTSPATTLQPPTANRLLTIQDGVRLTTDTDTLTAEMVAPFKAMIAKNWETPVVQLAAQLNRSRGIPANTALLSSAHGRGGVGITNLWKGTQPYANALTAVAAAKAECDRLGYSYKVPFVDWIHGENDRNSSAGLYTSRLIQMQSDYEADIKAITGQPEGIPLLLDQISNWTAYGGTESNVPFEQLQIALDYPDRFLCAGPKYWAQTSPDGIHLPSENSMRLGVQHKAPAKAVIEGRSWLPTHCVSATRAGLTVTMKFHAPNGALVSDVTNVVDPGNWGLRWIDDESSASIVSVRLVGDNTVQVTLSAIPLGANPKIGIADIGEAGAAAGPSTGARSCLRDSGNELDGYGQPIWNWACHQRIAVN
ncbi:MULTISPECIES: hypothetical protein [unclassified Pseudomonas]|uniref:hypothetical protein n=1 Tax=unclassified Pseudomonas TaxID=196821 RepID=UPI003FA1A41A